MNPSTPEWFVIDASIIVRAVSEKHPQIREKFKKLIKNVESGHSMVFSPPLLWIECANALRFSVEDKKLAQKLLKKIMALPIKDTQTTPEHLSNTLALSQEIDTTVYDSWYHLTAIWLGATFITADKKYFNKAKNKDKIEFWG